MKRQALAVLLAAGVAAPASVQAAGGTSVPPMLRGDLEFLFDGGIDFVALEDRRATDAPWEEVARSNQQRYGLDIIGRFSPFHGLGLELEIPIVFHEAWEWGEAREFQFDPESHQATMAGGRNLAAEELNATPSAVERAGFGDMSFAVRFLPFAQAGVPGREAPASLALDLHHRGNRSNNIPEPRKMIPGHLLGADLLGALWPPPTLESPRNGTAAGREGRVKR